MNNKNKSIKCLVERCIFNNDFYCNLDQIKVDCTCDGCDCEDKNKTICDSFEKKKDS